MTSSEFLMVVAVVMAATALMSVAAGEVYKVGDSAGWTDVGYVDYKTWAATKIFRVGDVIKFEYNKELHNVVRVTHENFRACNSSTPYTTLATGADSFNIKKHGHYFFICSLPGHCEAGQKVDIRVPVHIPPPITQLPFPPLSPPSVPPSSIFTPAPSPNNGSGEYLVKIWLTILTLVFGFTF